MVISFMELSRETSVIQLSKILNQAFQNRESLIRNYYHFLIPLFLINSPFQIFRFKYELLQTFHVFPKQRFLIIPFDFPLSKKDLYYFSESPLPSKLPI